MLELDLNRVRENAQASSTEDLLDRMTVYRAGLEPEALAIIRDELLARGVTAEDIADHEQRRRDLLIEGGRPVRCRLCSRPAVVRQWRWGKLFGVLPLFPRREALCAEHSGLPADDQRQGPSSGFTPAS
jgi:hypothetical protein